MSAIRILELRSVRGTGGGPEKTILLGARQSDPSRYAITVCYLRDARDPVFEIDTKAAMLGVDYVEVLERHSFDPGIWPALRRIVRERGIHIVHSHDYKTNLLAALLRRSDGTIPLCTSHGWTGNSRRERVLYYPADKQVLRLFPRVIAVSEDIRQELIRAGVKPERVQTVLNGIDHVRFRRNRSYESTIRDQLGLAKNDIVIGSVGRAERQKRFDLLIDTFARLRPRHPALKLLIVGDGSLRETLAQQVDDLGLRDACRLLGHRGDVAELHHAFDVFVQSSDYEGTPNAVLEAMALESAIVATDVGGTAQLVRDGVDGLIVPPGDSAALEAAIERVLAASAAAAQRTRSARRRVETDLSFATRMATVESIYADLCRRDPSSSTAVVTART